VPNEPTVEAPSIYPVGFPATGGLSSATGLLSTGLLSAAGLPSVTFSALDFPTVNVQSEAPKPKRKYVRKQKSVVEEID
jgi:hypothetical protein